MKLFNALTLKLEKTDWARNPEFGLIDTLLENHPYLLLIVKDDIVLSESENNFGRKDSPTVEQIMRAAIFKEMKGLDYRSLEYAQTDSRICASFIKLNGRQPFSFQLYQKYISRIKVSSLQKLLIEINRIAIAEGYEDINKVRQDTTVVKTNIHYPTNNALVWDAVKESHRLLSKLKDLDDSLDLRNYARGAKKLYFKINYTKGDDERTKLFVKQLVIFTKTINQVTYAIKKKLANLPGMAIQHSLEQLLPTLEKVYHMAYQREVLKSPVPNKDKIFSIYELHTDIIVKGNRDVEFGHKINLATGKSNLILDCQILEGNPNDKTLYEPTIERISAAYNRIPVSSTADGGFASKANIAYSRAKGIANTVFNKVVGSLQNVVSSLSMETRLKKWRSGIEANISNLKRGFYIRVCNWKGWPHYQSKVMWSVLGYNFRVLTALTLERIAGGS